MEGVSGEALAKRIEGADVQHISDLEEVAKELLAKVEPNSVVLTLSAGDANRVGFLVLQGLAQGGSNA